METAITAVDQQPAVQDTTALTLDSREGIIYELKEMTKDPKLKPAEKLRILDKIAELKGFKLNTASFKDIRNLATSELHDVVRDLCIPMLAPFGVVNGNPSLILENEKAPDPEADSGRSKAGG